MILCVAISIYLYFNIFSEEKESKPIFKLTQEVSPTSGHAPSTITFSIDHNSNQQANIDFNDIYCMYESHNPVQKLSENNTSVNYSYLMPDLFRPKYNTPDTSIFLTPVLIKSKGWETNICYKRKSDGKTFYKRLNSDTVLWRSNKKMIIEQSEISAITQMNNDEFFSEYRYFDSLNLPADQLTISTIAENSEESGGKMCHDIILIGKCEFGDFKVKLLNNGCTSWAEFQVSEASKNGKKDNLEKFGLDSNMPHLIKLNINKGKANLFIDENEIDSLSFDQPLGNLFGLIYVFKGVGSVSMLKLSQASSALEFDYSK